MKHNHPLIITSLFVVLSLMLSFRATPAVSAQTVPGCPLTQGYWATHPETWPTDTIILGSQSYSKTELTTLLPGGGGDASTILAVQLVAAKLNIAAGADATLIAGAVTQADALLSQFSGRLPYAVDAATPQGQVMVNTASTLDAYNNGLLNGNCGTAAAPTSTPIPPVATFTPTPSALSPTVTPAAGCPSGGTLLHSFYVIYGGRVYDPATNATTFTYIVCGSGASPDLSHFDIEIPVCAPALLVSATSPTDAVRFGIDPTTGVNGIKWDLPLQTSASRTYTLTFLGNVGEGNVQTAVKSDGFEIGSVPGPSCMVGSLSITKSFSTDGTNWNADSEFPGPQLAVGAPVTYRFAVRNIGNVDLTNLALTDSAFDASTCVLPQTLAPGQGFDCVVGPFAAVEGQHTNTATVSGVFSGQTVRAADTAYHFSGSLPLVRVEKFVSTDGAAWVNDLDVHANDNVSFKFVVTNIGNVDLSNFALTDSTFSTSTCVLPPSLLPATSFECTIGPFPVTESIHTNIATVSAVSGGQTVSDTDTASYVLSTEVEDETPIVVIEGPVEAINVNIITIFGVEIEVDPNDSNFSRIQIGNNIRIEGEVVNRVDHLTIVAITIINVDVDLVFVGQVYAAPVVAFYIPPGCKITGIGNGNPRLKCSGRSGSNR